MLARANELPLARDASGRYLPWIVAVMAYIAALSLAAALSLSSAIDRWGQGLAGTLTVQILPLPDMPADVPDVVARAEAAAAFLAAQPGVERVRILEEDDLQSLLEPWLGAGNLAGELPLPRLLDVTLTPEAAQQVAALSDRLAAAVPGTVVDDHKVWFSRLIAVARVVELIAAGTVLLIGLAAVATVVFATRTGLAVHRDVIQVLHLIGARDRYVALQFQRHALVLGLRGGLLGLALAVLTLVALAHVSAQVQIPLLPQLSLAAPQWAMLAALPLVTAVIAMLTARVTVLRELGRMP